MFTFTQNDTAATLEISGDLTIYTAPEFKDKLRDIYTDSKPLQVDLGKVGEIDSSGIQLLILLKKLRSDKNLEFMLLSIPGHVSEIFDILGITWHTRNEDTTLPAARSV